MINIVVSTCVGQDACVIDLGRQTEHDVRSITFDLYPLIRLYGDGEAVIVHQRALDVAPYAINSTRVNNAQIWTVTATDTGYNGRGRAELRWMVNGALAKTIIYKTIVERSITGDHDLPPVLASWYDAMLDYIDSVRAGSDAELAAAVEAAEHYAEVAQQGAEEAGFAWFAVNLSDGHAYVTVTDNLDDTVVFNVDESTGELEVLVNG